MITRAELNVEKRQTPELRGIKKTPKVRKRRIRTFLNGISKKPSTPGGFVSFSRAAPFVKTLGPHVRPVRPVPPPLGETAPEIRKST